MNTETTTSKFTPDSELDLLFPAEYISQEVKDQLHPSLHVRLPPPSPTPTL